MSECWYALITGVKYYKRKYWVDFTKLYICYAPASNPVSRQLYSVSPNKLYRYVKLPNISTLNVGNLSKNMCLFLHISSAKNSYIIVFEQFSTVVTMW